MSARIILFGATSYTQGRTAEAMAARGARPVHRLSGPEAGLVHS
jgi:short subunit dehydrogenase-like uncharacterized protein